jgi:hypothetical protein
MRPNLRLYPLNLIWIMPAKGKELVYLITLPGIASREGFDLMRLAENE